MKSVLDGGLGEFSGCVSYDDGSMDRAGDHCSDYYIPRNYPTAKSPLKHVPSGLAHEILTAV